MGAVRDLSGQCLCGAVRYLVADGFSYAANCHCGDCRRATGSAFKPFAGIERELLRLVGGTAMVMVYGDTDGAGQAGDVHCRTCGSLLFSIVRDGAWVHVAMGTLTDAPSIRPDRHIFVASKAPWYTITDDLPRYRGHAVAGGPDMPAEQGG